MAVAVLGYIVESGSLGDACWVIGDDWVRLCMIEYVDHCANKRDSRIPTNTKYKVIIMLYSRPQ